MARINTVTVKRYAKFVVALAGAVAIAGQALVTGDLDSVDGLVRVAIAVAAAFGVRQATNAP